MNLLACPCPALAGCVWGDTVSLPQKQLGAEERRGTSPSTWPGDSPGDQGHLPALWLLPCASACCNAGFSSPHISPPGLDVARSCSLFLTLIPRHLSSTIWPVHGEESPVEFRSITIGLQTRSQGGGGGLPVCHSRRSPGMAGTGAELTEVCKEGNII